MKPRASKHADRIREQRRRDEKIHIHIVEVFQGQNCPQKIWKLGGGDGDEMGKWGVDKKNRKAGENYIIT